MQNLFEILGIPVKLNLNTKELEDRFRELSLKFHPDRAPANAPETRAAAIKKSSQINLAYRTLCDPWSRATFAVETFAPDKTSDTPPSQLEQLMEIQEISMELQAAKMDDDFDKIQELSKSIRLIQMELNNRFNSLDSERDHLFDQFDHGDNQAIEKLKALLGERKYLQRVLQNIETSLT